MLAALRRRRRRCSGSGCRRSFLPEEDYGYFLLNIQLPPAASLERTDAVARKVDDDPEADRGRRATSTPSSASACSRASRPATTRSTSCSSKPWDERHDAGAAGARDRQPPERRSCAARVPEAMAFAIMPPSIPGPRQPGRLLAVAAGSQRRHRSSSSNDQLQKFLAAARQRPELAGVTSPFTASVPQIYADVDRDKVLRQGVALGDVYQTMQAFLGGLYVNQFNRFGRQWRVFLQAEGERPRDARADRPVLRAQRRRRRWCRCRRCRSTQPTFGPQFTNRFNVYRAAQITGAAAPGYSSGQAMAALEEVARADAAARDRLRLVGPVVPGAAGGRARRR